jgi:transglutaminase-like putative cysteine protease
MIYDISHKTLYRYSAPVVQSHHVLHMSPREVAQQTVRRHSLLVEPAPTSRIDTVDDFGNPATKLAIEDEHTEFVIHARSTIEVRPRAPVVRQNSCAWDQVHPKLVSAPKQNLDVLQFVTASHHTRLTSEIAAYLAPSLAPGRPVLEVAFDLTRRMYTEFTFDPTATDISTPVTAVLAKRRGVCQDFSHLALACLRSAKIPARYVSGYLLTRPPPGQVKLQGADASHAWISVWSPDAGWVDFDPTNGSVPDVEHISIATGRDYDDVSPITGILLGGGKHTVDVAVDVVQAQ